MPDLTLNKANEFNFSRRIPQLDGIRGLAIALVLVWHYFAAQIKTNPGSLAAYGMKLFSFTWAGVDVFFVLSGFLIGGILLDQRDAPNYFKAFYVRRFCRIFPLYYLMIGLFILAVWTDLSRGGGELVGCLVVRCPYGHILLTCRILQWPPPVRWMLTGWR